MDSPHHVSHIDFEYGVIVAAFPRGASYDVRGGYGIMCHWKPRERLAAYRGLRDWLDNTITEMEEAL